MIDKSKNKTFGIGLLIASILFLIISSLSQMALLFLMWIFNFGQSKEAVSNLFNSIFQQPAYTQFVLFLTPITELVIFVWSFILAIRIIKNNKYISQIKYLFYFILIKYLAFFVLYIPLKNYSEAITNLIVAIFIYLILIWKKGLLHKFLYK
jgi:hypothetical protein